jgi:ABC-2 type transport system permease protein
MALSLLVNVIALFSGIFFPIDGLGKFASKLSQISPLKWVLDSVFSIIYDGNFIRYTSTLLLLVLLSMAFVIIVHFNYRSEDYI